MLEQELAFYEEHRTEWLTKHPGRFVLVNGRELIGVFDNQDDALSEGARRFGLASFLVRRVEEAEELVQVPALTLGLLHADSQRSV
jgi:hypothetical protein